MLALVNDIATQVILLALRDCENSVWQQEAITPAIRNINTQHNFVFIFKNVVT